MKTLFFVAFVLVAAWGGWAVGRMGEDRAKAKNEAENSILEGSGSVREAGRPRVDPASIPKPIEVTPPAAAETKTPAPAKDKPAETKAAGSVDIPAETVKEEAPAPIAPPKLVIHSIGSAELVFHDAYGATRPYITNATGVFQSETIPAGTYGVTVNHSDYSPLAAPVIVTLKPGATTEADVIPVPRPASLIIITDAGATVLLDGTKVGGGGAVMLGAVPSRKPVSLKVLSGSETVKEVSLTLLPKENQLLDYRTAQAVKDTSEPEPTNVVTAEDAAKLATIAEKATAHEDAAKIPVIAPPAPVAKPVAAPVAPVTVAAKVISANTGSKLIAFTGPTQGKAPMEVGKAGTLRFPGLDAPMIVIKCVRTFGGVSVCEASALGPIATPAPAEITY